MILFQLLYLMDMMTFSSNITKIYKVTPVNSVIYKDNYILYN
jgi:hypothetical protein